MPDPSILIALRAQSVPDSTEFVRRFDRLKVLAAHQYERQLEPAELQELLLLRELMRKSLGLLLEKR